MGPRALILRAPGTNCDEETAEAWRRAGAEAETWHVNRLFEAPAQLSAFQILTLPGGFSYGDDLGAGRIMATRMARAHWRGIATLSRRGRPDPGHLQRVSSLGPRGPVAGRPRIWSRDARSQRVGPLRMPLGPPAAAPRSLAFRELRRTGRDASGARRGEMGDGQSQRARPARKVGPDRIAIC